jgi:hypothetical protein
MDRLQWVGPFVLRDYLGELLAMTGTVWPPVRAGVYVVTSQPWTGRPSPGHVLYTGGTGKLRHRIGDMIRDVLGFYGEPDDGLDWAGAHSGAQTLWEGCHQDGFPVGQLLIGWAATSDPCHWCTEKELARLLNPSKNKRTGRSTCWCQKAA